MSFPAHIRASRHNIKPYLRQHDNIPCVTFKHSNIILRHPSGLLPVVKEERTVRKPADKVIAPVLLGNPVLSYADITQKLGYCINFTVSISSDPSFPLTLHSPVRLYVSTYQGGMHKVPNWHLV